MRNSGVFYKFLSILTLLVIMLSLQSIVMIILEVENYGIFNLILTSIEVIISCSLAYYFDYFSFDKKN